ncbi:MAG: SpoIIE family protein phosphatase [Acidimicrobiales bacterium]
MLLLVGDVTGKGATAAAVMGRIRAFTKALADRSAGPGGLLSRLNAIMYGSDDMATLCCIVLDPGRTQATVALAGHPPPLLLTHDSGDEPGLPTARYLHAAAGLPLGAHARAAYPDTPVELPTDWTLLLYTDGLVERRSHGLDDGLEQLRRAAGAARHESVERLASEVLAACAAPSGQRDDIALLVARHTYHAPLRLTVPTDVSALAAVRRTLRRWLALRAPNADVDDVLICVCEAAGNSIHHAYNLQSGVVRITAETNPALTAPAWRGDALPFQR